MPRSSRFPRCRRPIRRRLACRLDGREQYPRWTRSSGRSETGRWAPVRDRADGAFVAALNGDRSSGGVHSALRIRAELTTSRLNAIEDFGGRADSRLLRHAESPSRPAHRRGLRVGLRRDQHPVVCDKGSGHGLRTDSSESSFWPPRGTVRHLR
jgi:hypothetical protein